MLNATIAAILSESETRADPETKDRRRLGRPAHASLRLVGLLRGDFAHVPFSEDVQLENPLSAARGLVLGTMLGLLIWAAAYSVARYLLG